MDMIYLSIQKEQAEGGASRFRMLPEHISLGSMGANNVDQLKVALPQEWSGMTVRLTFVPDSGASIAVLLDAAGVCTLTGDITGADAGGQIVVDAVGTDGYVAYSAMCTYHAEPHVAAGGSAQGYTKDEYQQFIAAVQGYSETAAAARQETAEMADAVAREAGIVGTRSFAINADGDLIQTAAYTLAGTAKTETKTSVRYRRMDRHGRTALPVRRQNG
jgi:hypothetical protein